jgi:hypothetical protein
MTTQPAQGTTMTAACALCAQTGRPWGTFDTVSGDYACDRCVIACGSFGKNQLPSGHQVTGYVSGAKHALRRSALIG